MADPLRHGRDAYARRAWGQAYAAFAGAPRSDLDAADLERLAVAAYLIGEDDESAAAWEAAHRRHVAEGDLAGAALCSFWLALCLLLRGQPAHAGGWLQRTEAILESADVDCAASGYVLVPALLVALADGDAVTARSLAVEARRIGERLDDSDLRAFATLGHGQALIASGETAAGIARLDDVMVSVTSGDVGPITSGIVYCAVLLECMQTFELARAREWTDALEAWCVAQPDLVPYRGQCLVHRSQLQQAAGAWAEAMSSIESACRRLTEPPHPALGLAYYQEAELHRLTGSFDAAAACYRLANRQGYPPMPGLALLELARGNGDAAAAAVRRALATSAMPSDRPAVLAAAVEILAATRDAAGARQAADVLAAVAAASGSEVLRGMATYAAGVALLSEGSPAGALIELRAAATAWQRLGMPYESARTAALLGRSYTELGDATSASLELERAREIFTELGAGPDLARVASTRAGAPRPGASDVQDGPSRLSVRERQVLGYVAAGKTNREIAAELAISPHTVGRHLENIFVKLGVTTRAAAIAHAYEHGLL